MDQNIQPSFARRLKKVVIGKARNPQDPGVFHRLALIAFFAWVGLGVDGLSSSCYGPSEAFLALNGNHYLGIFVALGSVITIFVISASYSQIIELFPSGGGGYLVASKLLSPTFGMISGCALLIDYVLTIALSVSSGAEAIFSFMPVSMAPLRIYLALLGVILLTLLNMRGVKESVLTVLPIFLIFVATHLFAIVYTLIFHAHNIPIAAQGTISQINSVTSQVGVFGLIFLVLRAYSMGAGTYTGIEAVSNGLPILRDPKVQTGKRTMRYMAFSLAITVLGLMLSYILFDVHFEAGKTLNAVFFENLTSHWGKDLAYVFVLITLLSEAAILFVAAQTGFIDGPRVLANMAMDRWMPSKFANLSDRLVTQNGVVLMSAAAFILVLLSKGSVHFLVILYSINVFITFVLSQLGMVRHWWNERVKNANWKKRITINGIGLVMTVFILFSVLIIKFHEGGWITLVVTGGVIGFVLLVKRHYNNTTILLRRLDDLVKATELSDGRGLPNISKDKRMEKDFDPRAKTAVLLVNGFNGLGLHALFNIFRMFSGIFKNFVFIQVGVVDAGVFKGASEVQNLQLHIDSELNRYAELIRRHGYHAECFSSIGVDILDEIEKLSPQIIEKFPNSIFFGGQIVFKVENILSGWLHNHVVFAIQRRFYHKGIPFIILPIKA